MIKKVLQDPAVVPKNVYNIDETGIILSMLSYVKVLVGRDNMRDYRGVGVKQTIVTSIKCISSNSRVLLLLII